MSVSYILAMLMSIVMGGKTLALFQRPNRAGKKQKQTTNNSGKSLHNKWKPYTSTTQFFQVESLRRVVEIFNSPSAIKTTLNHCASLKPNPTAGLIRQNSTTKRDKPVRIK